ncbi:hypothetical protein B0H63DRAFT_447672 [Podospora didyma]|uniref:Uncharacterized protein n=1 Tax=Podospora didyma TaxID=330526 RepID=A0AAE0NSA4_9PEZI|nr:hypothetical protein B0H63DRAFT_447672 [Podospora didyma]
MHVLDISLLLALTQAAVSLVVPPATGEALSPRALELTKRAVDGVYLSNCATRQVTGSITDSSEMDFYNNAKSGSQFLLTVVIAQQKNLQDPDDIASFGNSGFVTWEGTEFAGFFSSGAEFTSAINPGAENLPTGAVAGSGINSFGAEFTCFKDNGRELYTEQQQCFSVYFCFQN